MVREIRVWYLLASEFWCSSYRTNPSFGISLCRSTLKIHPACTYESRIMDLKPARVTCCMDGCPSKSVNFRGCKIIRLHGRGSMEIRPVDLTVAGPCYYTKEDKKDFEIMFRTREQSLLMKLPYISKFDWPDYRVVEQCPKCCKRAKASSSSNRYWLVYQMCRQRVGIECGVRMMPRLICEACFESIIDDCSISVQVGSQTGPTDVPLLDAIEAQGPITWLQHGYTSSHTSFNTINCGHGHYHKAYKLYTAWEYSGTFQAMCNEIGNMHNGVFVNQQPAPASTYWEMSQIPNKEGRKCDFDGCSNVHGKREAPKPGQKKGRKTRLQECMGCYDAMYCSEECQKAAWPDHKAFCTEAQQKRKEEEEKEKARQKWDHEEKVAAALASFVPLSITPQGGGGVRKKKGKKGGAKKKKGKK